MNIQGVPRNKTFAVFFVKKNILLKSILIKLNCHIIIFVIFFDIKQIMEEDILNYSPAGMFRGTPCS